MKKNVMLYCILFCCLLLIGNNITAVPSVTTSQKVESVFELSPKDIIQLNKVQLENRIGRKLSFKEKIALKLVKKKLKKRKDLTSEKAYEQTRIHGLAVAGFVTGLVSIFFAGIILGVLSVVFSGIALGKIKQSPDTFSGKGLAIAGLILGLIGAIGALILVAMVAT